MARQIELELTIVRLKSKLLRVHAAILLGKEKKALAEIQEALKTLETIETAINWLEGAK